MTMRTALQAYLDRLDRRTSRGAHTVELACVLIVFAIVTVLSVDIGIVCLANSTNDQACRDACRAAAQGKDYATALKLAQAAIKSHAIQSPYFGTPTLDMAEFQYNDFGGDPPPNTSPYVRLATYMTVKVPAPVNFAGAKFYPGNGQTQVRKEYEFPIVKTQLYLP
jgi:hypothetical protein